MYLDVAIVITTVWLTPRSTVRKISDTSQFMLTWRKTSPRWVESTPITSYCRVLPWRVCPRSLLSCTGMQRPGSPYSWYQPRMDSILLPSGCSIPSVGHSTYLMGWFRDYLWFNSAQVVNGYPAFGVNKNAVWDWMCLFGLNASQGHTSMVRRASSDSYYMQHSLIGYHEWRSGERYPISSH